MHLPLKLTIFSEFTKCGRVYMASSTPNEIMLRRMYSRGNNPETGGISCIECSLVQGVIQNDDVELIDCPSEMLARWPFLQTEDIQVWFFCCCEIRCLMIFVDPFVSGYVSLSFFFMLMWSSNSFSLASPILTRRCGTRSRCSLPRAGQTSSACRYVHICLHHLLPGLDITYGFCSVLISFLKVLISTKIVQLKRFCWVTNAKYTPSTLLVALWKHLDS